MIFKKIVNGIKNNGLCGFIKRIIIRIQNETGICNANRNIFKTKHPKNCLLVYIREPFLYSTNYTHQNLEQVKIIAECFSDLGYNVDVTNYMQQYHTAKKYDVIFDICVTDSPFYNRNLKSNAKKIVYFTTSEPEFANTQEELRAKALFERRGINVSFRRKEIEFSHIIENYDGAVLIGNNYILNTYLTKYNLSKTFLVNNTGYNFPKDFFNLSQKCKNCFLYFSSTYSIHRGLDLLLEVFSKRADLELYICGDFYVEKDFCSVYQNELFNCNNIHPIGFVDIMSNEFLNICKKCVYMILPSCAEGQSGSVTTCMSAGLIPICSRECGFDEEDVILLNDCNIDTINNIVTEMSHKDNRWIANRIKYQKELSNNKYSINNFRNDMRKAIENIL